MKLSNRDQALNIYVSTVIVFGLMLFFYSMLSIDFSHFPLPQIITFLILTIVTELLPIHLSPNTSISVSFP